MLIIQNNINSEVLSFINTYLSSDFDLNSDQIIVKSKKKGKGNKNN